MLRVDIYAVEKPCSKVSTDRYSELITNCLFKEQAKQIHGWETLEECYGNQDAPPSDLLLIPFYFSSGQNIEFPQLPLLFIFSILFPKQRPRLLSKCNLIASLKNPFLSISARCTADLQRIKPFAGDSSGLKKIGACFDLDLKICRNQSNC